MAAAVAAPLLDEDDWVFPHSLVYKGYLLNLMSFVHKRVDNVYPKDHVFMKEELLAVQPHHIRKWMNWRGYCVSSVTNSDDNAPVTGCCSNALLTESKASHQFLHAK
jgi:hypothetical protein